MKDFPKQPSCGRKSSTMMNSTLRLGPLAFERSSGVAIVGTWQVVLLFPGATSFDALAVLFGGPFLDSGMLPT